MLARNPNNPPTHNGMRDDNNVAALGGSVKRVSEDEEGDLLEEAVLEHEDNFDVAATIFDDVSINSRFLGDSWKMGKLLAKSG